jgi:hypothetical protein
MFLWWLVWHVARLIRSPLPGAGAVYPRRFAVHAPALCVGACAGLPGSAAARSTPECFPRWSGGCCRRWEHRVTETARAAVLRDRRRNCATRRSAASSVAVSAIAAKD